LPRQENSCTSLGWTNWAKPYWSWTLPHVDADLLSSLYVLILMGVGWLRAKSKAAEREKMVECEAENYM
jgi:hypothetical protein